MFSSKNAVKIQTNQKTENLIYLEIKTKKKQRKNYKLYIKKVTIGFRKVLELNNNEKIMY